MTLPNKYVSHELQNEHQLNFFFNDNEDIYISITQLGNTFWPSGDLISKADQYLKLFSAAKYDSSITNIKKQTLVIDDYEVANIELSIENELEKIRSITILTDDKYNSIAIEFYGKPEDITKNTKQIYDIINNIRFK